MSLPGPPEGPGPGSPASLRGANQRRIVEALKEQGQLTQAELARQTGLAASTVSNIVAQLRRAGIVAAQDGPAGRRGQLVRFVASAGVVAGIDVAHDQLRVALADLAHTVLAEHVEPLQPDHRCQDVLARAQELIADLCQRAGIGASALRAAGLAVPAPISPDCALVSAPTVLPGWAECDLREAAGAALGVPVVVDNDANLGALAEHRWGAGREIDHLAYVTLGHGVGAGLILDGQLYHGARGVVGEIGHVSIDPAGPFCGCGNRGCLTGYVSATTLPAQLGNSRPALTTAADVIAAAQHGDPACRRVLSDVGRLVGAAIAPLVALLDPALVIIGGTLATAGELLVQPLRQGLAERVIPTDAVAVECAALGPRAHVLGAVAVAIDRTILPLHPTG